MIDINKMFDKYSSLCNFEEGPPEYLIDREDFNTAVKEIITEVLQKAADNARPSYEGEEDEFGDVYFVNEIDKQSILDTIKEIKFD